MAISNNLIRTFERSQYYNQSIKASKKLKNIFSDSLGINNEKVLIVSDSGEKNNASANMLSYAYHTAAQDLGLNSELVLQKPRNRTMEVSPEVLNKLKTLPKKSVIMQCVSNRLGTLNGLGKSFRKYCYSRDHRFTSASSLGNVTLKNFDTLVDAHNYNYKQMMKKQESIKKKLDSANEVHISTKAGTDMYLGIENSKAVYNHGVYKKPKEGGNLPAGEVYVPINRRHAYGKLVIDGSSRQKDTTVLCKNPINIYFDNGIARKITGGKEAEGLRKTYEWAEKRAKFPWGIKMASELGIGLNDKSKLIGATILDEKVKGTAHIATGSNHWFGGDIKAIIHLDQVFKNPTIKLDGKKLNI